MCGQLLERREEGARVGEADLPHDVPVAPARRKEERAPRKDAEETAVRVEVVEERLEVVRVSAAPVSEDERSGRGGFRLAKN
jgi:hypothetical protein